MKIVKLSCSNCGGFLDMKVDNNSNFVFCPYCGQKFLVDDEKRETTINKNININRVERHVDDAKIIKEQCKEKKDKRDTAIGLIVGLGVPLVLMIVIGLCFWIPSAIAKSQGKVSVGNYKDLIGKDYKTVVAHFESAGFDDIEIIDLKDSGLMFWNDGKVVSISVGGDNTFESVDYFSPEEKVVISYH